MNHTYRALLRAAVLTAVTATSSWAQVGEGALQVVVAVTAAGDATDQWLALISKRLAPADYQAVAQLRKPLAPAERAWVELIQSRVRAWEGEIPALAVLFLPIKPPTHVLILLGNRGGQDAFTQAPTTIGFDLAVLQSTYGDAALPANTERIDRFFRHEYVHLLQKAWLNDRPYPTSSPLRTALAEIWTEGLGNYYSMSERWRVTGAERSEETAAVLATLEARFAARLAALACASTEDATRLTADLSRGRFTDKWGALPAATWLDAEVQKDAQALRDFVVAGPDGVWDLAERNLSDELKEVVREARLNASLCGEPSA